VHPFRKAVEARDHAAAVETLAPDVVFHTPVRYKQVEGREAASVVLGAALTVLEDFRYTDELEGPGTLALRFEARVGDREVEGVDLLRFDDDGLIADFTVMVRPLSGVNAVAEAMARELARAGA
jgi:hypothetical protein